MKPIAIDSDHYRDRKQLQALLDERCERQPDGCLLYHDPIILVRCQGYTEPVAVSPARVAWALAHPKEHLTVHERLVHTCNFGTNKYKDQRVCCNIDHLKRGGLEEVIVMKATRRHRLVLQKESA